MHRKVIAILLLACLTAVLCSCVAAGPTATNAFSFACAAGDNCGVFATIVNPNSQADTLLAARSDAAPRVELHTMVKDAQGNMKMQQVANIPLPPASTVELKPGSLHVMMFGLSRELKAGDTFDVTLKYEKAGEQTVKVSVRPRN